MSARIPGLIASTFLASVAILYFNEVYLTEDDRHDSGVVFFFAGTILSAALLAAGGSVAQDPYWRRLQFGIAAAIVFVCSWLTGASIGPLFWLPLLLLVYAVIRG